MSGPQDPLLDAIMKAIDRPCHITGYVVLAEFMDDDGEKCIWCDTLEDQRCHNTLGLLAFGSAVETKRAQDTEVDE